MKWLWHLLLARFRLSQKWICEMSKGKSEWNDYHDYHDDVLGTPAHFVLLKCEYCGKEFYI